MPRRQQSKRRREAGLPSRKLTRAWHEVEDDDAGYLSPNPPAPQPLISHPPLTPLPSHPPDGTEHPPSWLERLARIVARILRRKPRAYWP